MDLFPDGTHVRLQSRELGTYLYADEDGFGVSLSGNRASLNVAWQVHRIMHEGSAYVLLHGAAYGRYLGVSHDAAPRGHRGFRVVQSDRDYFDPRAVMWRAIRGWDEGDDVIVRHDLHRNLRGNGRYRRWNRGVTVEDTVGPSTMTRWIVQAIPPRATPPEIPIPVATPNVGPRRGLFRRSAAVAASDPQWVIFCVVADDDGNVDDYEDTWDNFMFTGRSVFSLKARVAFREGHTDANHFVLCVKAGHQARRTPLVTDLLPSQVHPLNLVALTNGSPGAAALVYPDVDAEAPPDAADAEAP